MAQNNEISREFTRYTRVDFAALRYRLNGIPAEKIADLYSDHLMAERGFRSPDNLVKWLDQLKRYLIDLAIKQNPGVAQILESANKSGRWFNAAMSLLVDLGEKDYSYPTPQDAIAQWFKKRVAQTLQEENVQTVSDLKNLIERRGKGWYRSIPRIGPGKAAVFERWINTNSEYLGAIQWPREIVTYQHELSPASSRPWVPLENIGSIVQGLNGSNGINRNHAFCLISARNDLEAIQAWLYKYRDHPPTYRAYRKEIERFLLWCVCVRKTALSNSMIEDCEAYKEFLNNIPALWIAPRVARRSSLWRPFATQLSRDSQRYAVQIIRNCFEWLVRIRYLGGNPWIAVSDPPTEQQEIPIQIHRALPQDIWQELIKPQGWLDQLCEAAQVCVDSTQTLEKWPYGHKSKQGRAAQYRLARAAIFLIGFTGIRREEAARAKRKHLKPVHHQEKNMEGHAKVWELAILGKRNKWRTVYLPARVLDALEAHWLDRGLSLRSEQEECVDSTHLEEAHLLSPVVLPKTPAAQNKHQNNLAGFEPDALYAMAKTVLLRMAGDLSIDLDKNTRELILKLAPHALRHTFATGAAAHDMPVDVLQSLLGHTSVQTTSLYVQAEKARSVKEVQKIFSKMTLA